MKKLLLFILLAGLLINCKEEEPQKPFFVDSINPEQGLVGTTVTIKGQGFSAVAAENIVKVGGVVAPVSNTSIAQLIISVPAGAKTGPITVEMGGRTTSSAIDFVVIEGPTVTSFSPMQAEEGDPVSIKGTNLSSATVVKFNGITAKTVTQISSTELSVIVPEGATTGKITLTDVGKTVTTTDNFTVVIPLSGKATVTKLAAITATGTAADGVRMCLWSNNLYITGPTQNNVFKLDLATLGVAPFQSITGAFAITSGANTDLLVGNTGTGNYYTYRLNRLSKTTTNDVRAIGFSLVPFSVSNNKHNFVTTNVNNELVGLSHSSDGDNVNSSYAVIMLNSQLKGIPSQASARLAANTKSLFVFANHVLWKLQADNTLKLVAGTAGKAGYQDGAGSQALFQDLGYTRGNAISVDANDNVYVADGGCGCIRKVDAQGNVSTVAGNIKLPKNTINSRGNRMRFSFDQWDMVLAPNGTLYVIADNDVSTPTLRFAVYKIVFAP